MADKQKNTHRLWLLLLLVFAVVTVFAFKHQVDIEAINKWIGQSGAAAPIFFIVLYALATVLFFPGILLTLSGGILFGPVLGTLYNLLGATIGATLAFILARYIARDWAEQRISKRLQPIKTGVEQEGWRFIAFVRLVPLFPFNLLNYALGLTRIRLPTYAFTSFICMIPGGFSYTYLGYAGREALSGEHNLIEKLLIAIALVATVAFIPRIIKAIRRSSSVQDNK